MLLYLHYYLCKRVTPADLMYLIDGIIMEIVVMHVKYLFAAAIVLLSLFDIAHAAGDPKIKSIMARSDCFTCHSIDHQVVGPAYKDVAKRYHGTAASAATIAILSDKIIKGGNGNWNKETGGSPMTAHAKLSKAQAANMVKWVLAQ